MKSMKNAAVSVIIPTFRRNDLVIRSIKSVYAQTYQSVEILVVDDSPERAFEVIEGTCVETYGVKVFYTGGRGAAAARNLGIEMATGKYIAFLDDDDAYLPQKLELHVECMESSSSNVSYSGTRFISSGNVTREHSPHFSGNVRHMLLVYNFMGTPTIMVLREFIEQHTIRFDETMRKLEDWDFVIQLATNSEVQVIRQPLVEVYLHDGERITTSIPDPMSEFYAKHKGAMRSIRVLLLHGLYSLKNRVPARFFEYWKCVWR